MLLGFPELHNGVTYSSAALFIAGELLRHVHRKLISPSCRAFTEGGRFRPRNALRAFNASRTAPTACDPRSASRLLRAPSYRSHKGSLTGWDATTTPASAGKRLEAGQLGRHLLTLWTAVSTRVQGEGYGRFHLTHILRQP